MGGIDESDEFGVISLDADPPSFFVHRLDNRLITVAGGPHLYTEPGDSVRHIMALSLRSTDLLGKNRSDSTWYQFA